MKKQKAPMLRPINVGEIYPVIDNSGRVQRLKGCKFTVVYNGVASVDARTLSQMGLYSGGYGSTYTGLEIKAEQTKPRTTMVEYFFREGALFPEPFARANKFKGALQSAITDFVPMEHPVIKADLKHDVFGESYIGAYHVVVRYPHAAQKNPLFHDFITNGMPWVAKVVTDTVGVEVIYVFKNEKGVQSAYNDAMTFKSYLLGQMTKRQNENIK